MPKNQELTPTIHIGCSGWQYRHWRGDFYPTELPPTRWLEHYATHFDTVEINNTFYRLPEAATFAAWARRVPRGFVYAVKASRYLTHTKKLKDPDDPVELFFSRAKRLGATFGPILYQLPPRWPLTSASLARFENFMKALPPKRRHVVEFREPSWYAREVFALLQRHRVALCLHDMHGSAISSLEIGPFVYMRFHGTQKYGGRYSDAALDAWAERLAGEAGKARPIYVYFNNDAGGHAPRDAMRLRKRVLALLP